MSEKPALKKTATESMALSDVVLRVENILIKNLSLEIPEQVVAPSFKEEPTIKMELRNSSRRLSREDYYEVTLEVTMRLQSGDKVQLLIEATQAGVMLLQNADERQREEVLNIYAPEMLYPYTSQLVSELMMRAGSPRVFLPPFNFRAIYEKKRKTAQQAMAAENDRPTETQIS